MVLRCGPGYYTGEKVEFSAFCVQGNVQERAEFLIEITTCAGNHLPSCTFPSCFLLQEIKFVKFVYSAVSLYIHVKVRDPASKVLGDRKFKFVYSAVYITVHPC